MDLSGAVLLLGVVYAATEFLKKLVPTLDARLTQLSALVIATGAVFLVGETVWAHEQIVGGQPLDALNVFDKVVVGLIVGFGSNFVHSLVGKDGAIRHIGQNVEPPARPAKRAK